MQTHKKVTPLGPMGVIVAFVCISAPAHASIDVEHEAHAVAGELGQQYADARAVAKATLPSQIDQLTARLRRLNAIEVDLADTNDSVTRASAMQYRALGWIHGWAVFSALVATSRKWVTDTQRWQLVDLETPSALRLLFDTYGQIARSAADQGGPANRPLLIGPGAECARCFELFYQQPLLARDEKPQADGRYYVPATAELVGRATDRPQTARNLLSLWALLNIEIDDWQFLDGQQNLLTTSPPLVKWLRQWETSPSVRAIDADGALAPRLERRSV